MRSICSSNTYTAPSLRILKVQPDLLRRRLVSHDPQHNQYREEAEDVNDEHDALKRGQLPQEHRVCCPSDLMDRPSLLVYSLKKIVNITPQTVSKTPCHASAE